MTVRITRQPVRKGPRVYESADYGRAVAAAEGGTWAEVGDDGGAWSIPLITRPIPGSDLLDASTPYGYGGINIREGLSDEDIVGLWDETRATLANAGVVSMFLRLPPFVPTEAARLTGLEALEITEVSQTFVVALGADASMWAAMHKRGRTAVRAAEKNGCHAEVVPVDEPSLRNARHLYEETMRRVGADARYYFPDEYYERLRQLGDRLVIVEVRGAENDVVAASFILRDDHHAHYHLSGSTGAASGSNNLMIWATMQWAAREGLESLHLGGGVTAGDSLHRFKAAFGGAEVPFHVGKAILRPDEYQQLTADRARTIGVATAKLASGSFFPAYRASA